MTFLDKLLSMKSTDDMILQFVCEILSKPEEIFVKVEDDGDENSDITAMQVFPPEGGESALNKLTFRVNVENNEVRLVRNGNMRDSILASGSDSKMVRSAVGVAMKSPVFDSDSQCVSVVSID